MNDKLEEMVNIEELTAKQEYVFKTILGWADKEGITPRNIHIDGTVEDQNGNEHDSPVDQVPIESKEQLIVLAGPNGELDKIFFSPKDSADGINVTKSLNPMEGIELTEETSTFEEQIDDHVSLRPRMNNQQ